MSSEQSAEPLLDTADGTSVAESRSPRSPRRLHAHHGALATLVFVAVMFMSIIGVVTDATGARATEGAAPGAEPDSSAGVATTAVVDPTDMYTAMADIAAGVFIMGLAQSAADVPAPAPASTPPVAIQYSSPPVAASAPAPAPDPTPAPAVDNGGRWDQLAQCESGGNWGYPPVSGGFSGGIMFHIGTWLANGGGEFAPDAYLASREQQITVAERVLAGSGWGAWPGCSRRFGWL
jgi:hypothetical protein